MNWNDVRYFLAVTRHGGLTGAAREMKASPSTVARRVETLEAALRTRLFERKPDGYELTEAGRAMVEKATAIEAAMHELEDGFCGQDGHVSGTVRIVTVDTLAHHLLMPNLPVLQEAYPDLALGIAVNATSFAQLPYRESDIGLRLCRPEQGNFVVRRIGTIGFGLYASKDYLARHPVREDQLPIAGHRLITWGDPLSFLALPKTLRSWVESGIANLTVDSMQAQLLAMKAGNGLGVLPCILADEEEQLVRLRPDLCQQEEAIWLVVSEAVRDMRRIRVVCDFLETIVKQGQLALSGQAR
ncbi:LysR family transcriptional regulator [Aureimonas pseudogalii]|uniref:DNA-binding transcriptional LysR family regulator n=1 Tax=Aureimonas pseudogalii TaxID=1744844 RepID=A0A7W6H898_9HYPH|nr:LysR family transcriptional regulator [Aureimonas pseudogalii]MBB4000337.1 DNA-binding transcriptional LysR family regulator [Aureimonas pseudogalii]